MAEVLYSLSWGVCRWWEWLRPTFHELLERSVFLFWNSRCRLSPCTERGPALLFSSHCGRCNNKASVAPVETWCHCFTAGYKQRARYLWGKCLFVEVRFCVPPSLCWAESRLILLDLWFCFQITVFFFGVEEVCAKISKNLFELQKTVCVRAFASICLETTIASQWVLGGQRCWTDACRGRQSVGRGTCSSGKKEGTDRHSGVFRKITLLHIGNERRN